MKTLCILLIINGLLGILGFFIMYGDIGWSAGIAGVGSILSAIGFFIQNKK